MLRVPNFALIFLTCVSGCSVFQLKNQGVFYDLESRPQSKQQGT